MVTRPSSRTFRVVDAKPASTRGVWPLANVRLPALLSDTRRLRQTTVRSSDIATTLSHDWLYANPDHMVTFAGNHDTRRFMSEKDADAAGLKMAMTFSSRAAQSLRFIMGTRSGLTGGDDPDNRHDFRRLLPYPERIHRRGPHAASRTTSSTMCVV